ncbi:hypothetical protein ACWDAZ_41440, partial [Streptomyces sp. NPDC001215]
TSVRTPAPSGRTRSRPTTRTSCRGPRRPRPYPLSQVVTDIERALERKSFHDRIAEKLAEDPAWG